MKFRFVTLDINGREGSGTIDAATEDAARAVLSANGDLIVSIKEEQSASIWKFERKSGVTAAHAASFAMDLSGLISAGAPLKNAMEIIASQKDKSARIAAYTLRRLEDGIPLSVSLKEFGDATQTLSEFVKAGEAGAGLPQLLQTGGEFLNARAEMVSKMKNALAYPVFILILAFAAISLMIVYVAPALAPTLSEQGDAKIILILAQVGEFVQAHSSILLIAFGLILFALLIAGRFERTKIWLATFAWYAPFTGPVIRDMETAQSAQIIAALLKSGTPIEKALSYGARVSGPVLSQLYLNTAERLRDGVTVGIAFSAEQQFPDDLKRLTRLGEVTGALTEAISQAGELSKARATRKIETFSAVIGPFLVIAIGALIAFMMLSVLSSLTSIGEGVL